MINNYKTYCGVLFLLVALCSFGNMFGQASTITINGTVSDIEGYPLQGVLVSSKSTFDKTYSLKDGSFKLNVTGFDSLFFYKNGYMQESALTEFIDNIQIKLKPSTYWDDVIRLSYDKTTTRRLAGGAYSTTYGSTLNKTRMINTSSTLAGLLPGLITNMGLEEPGYDGSSMYIRGINSMNSVDNNTYVDNLPISFGQLEPLEIDQLTIMKDGPANGLFGSVSANKAVVVNTRRGEAFNKKISFFTQTGFLKPITIPEYVSGKDYMRLWNEARLNDGLNSQLFTPEQIKEYDNPNRNQQVYPDVDWHKNLIADKTLQQKYNVTFSGGDNFARYFVFLGYTNQGGLFNYNNLEEEKNLFNTGIQYKRYNFRTNFDLQAFKSLLVSLDLAGRLENKNFPGTGTSNIMTGMARVPGVLFPMFLNSTDSVGGNSLYTGTATGATPWRRNPFGMISKLGYVEEVHRNLYGTAKLKQDFSFITPGLSATAAFSFFNFHLNTEGRQPNPAGFPVYSIDPVSQNRTSIGNRTTYTFRTRSQNQSRTNIFWAKLDYLKQKGEHQIDATLGYNQSIQVNSTNDDFPYPGLDAFGRLFYAYKQKYIAEFTASYGGTDVLPDENKFALFPALALGWIASDEEFIKSISAITFLKVRASYGLLGNSKFGIGTTGRNRYLFGTTYASVVATDNYTFGTTAQYPLAGYQEGVLPNTSIRYEKQHMINVGLDASFFDGFLNLSMNYFNENRFDIPVFPATLSGVVGIGTQPVNKGEFSNKGLDWDFFLKKQWKDLKLEAHFLGTYAKNKIVFQDETNYPYSWLYRTGLAADTPFGLTADGLYTAEEVSRVNNVADKSLPKPTYGIVNAGDIKYKDLNKDGYIDRLDESALGKPFLPELYYGVSTAAQWKNLDFSILFQGTGDRHLFLRNDATNGFLDDARPTTELLDRWDPANPEVTAKYPRLSFSNANNRQNSTFWLRNSKYIRLKAIELGYTLPNAVTNKVRMYNVRMYVNGVNLWTKHSLGIDYIDPESSSTGLTNYPRTSSVNFGVYMEL